MAEMIEFLARHWGWMAGLGGLVIAAAVLALGRRFATREELQEATEAMRRAAAGLAEEMTRRNEAAGARMGQLERDMTVVLERLKHMPSSDDMRRVEKGLGGLAAAVERLEAQNAGQTQALASVAEQVQTLTRHLLEGGGR